MSARLRLFLMRSTRYSAAHLHSGGLHEVVIVHFGIYYTRSEVESNAYNRSLLAR